jgi:hypothetical protein
LMRRPTVNVPVASNDGFGFFFQRNWNSQPANTEGSPLVVECCAAQLRSVVKKGGCTAGRRAGQYYQPMQQRWW